MLFCRFSRIRVAKISDLLSEPPFWMRFFTPEMDISEYVQRKPNWIILSAKISESFIFDSNVQPAMWGLNKTLSLLIR